MSEPAKDTAIEITPKPQTSSVRVPRIVAEINRVASRVRDRNKKEEEDNDDAEVLENDTPTPSQKPVDIKIIRENTHRPRGVDRVIVGLLVFISILLLIGCVLLGLVLKDERTKNTPSSETPLSSPPSSETPFSSTAQEIVEYKKITWDVGVEEPTTTKPYLSFTGVMKREGLSNDEIFVNCSYPEIKREGIYEGLGLGYPWAPTWNYPWSPHNINLGSKSRACVLTVLLNKLTKDNWELEGPLEYDIGLGAVANSGPATYAYSNPITFKRTTPLTSSVATSKSALLENKLVFWNNTYADFKTSAVNEGITTSNIEACYSGTTADWEQMWVDIPGAKQMCLVLLLKSTLEKENWTLKTANVLHNVDTRYAYHFTRPPLPPPPPPSPPPPSSWDGSCLGPSCNEVSCGSNSCKNGGYCEPTNTALCLCPPAYGGDECSSTSS